MSGARAPFIRRTVIQIVAETAPPPPPCFNSRAQWHEWIVSAHESGEPVLHRYDTGRYWTSQRTARKEVRPRYQLDYCSDCCKTHQRQMMKENRCMHATTDEPKTAHEAEIARLTAELKKANEESHAQQEGALLYIAAMVHKIGGAVELSAKDMQAAMKLELSRADQADGGLWLRTAKAEPLVLVKP